jgi:hypothetical protein
MDRSPIRNFVSRRARAQRIGGALGPFWLFSPESGSAVAWAGCRSGAASTTTTSKRFGGAAVSRSCTSCKTGITRQRMDAIFGNSRELS